MPEPPVRHAIPALTDVVEHAFGVVPDSIYFAASDLDVRPRPTNDIAPPYPRIGSGEGGYVVLELLIDETGVVDRVHVAIAEPEGVFEQAIMEAFSAARFTPGMRNGIAVKSRTWIELRFHPVGPPGLPMEAGVGAAAR